MTEKKKPELPPSLPNCPYYFVMEQSGSVVLSMKRTDKVETISKGKCYHSHRQTQEPLISVPVPNMSRY